MSTAFPDVVFFFDTMSLDGYARERYEEILRSLNGICDVKAVVHTEQGENSNKNEIFLNNDQIFRSTPQIKSANDKLIPGNCDLKFINAARIAKKYQRIIWWEYDVYCTKDLRTSVIELIKLSEGNDLVASYISRNTKDGWMWWETLGLPKALQARRIEITTRAFLPLFVASQRFVDHYITALKDGLTGHSEVTMPTIASAFGLAMLDISRPPHHLTSYPQFGVIESKDLNRFAPTFIHPIKNSEQRLAAEAQLAFT